MADGIDKLVRALAIALVVTAAIKPWIEQAAEPVPGGGTAGESARSDRPTRAPQPRAPGDRETVVGGYIAQPFYYRSNVRMKRNDGTDIELKRMGWDGDALYPPIDGGVRSVHWRGATGFMIDFLHNKAVSRLGKGAHGNTRGKYVIEEVEATGSLKGLPAPARLKLTELFERFEFTHGHNVLIFTGMARLGALTPSIRPYVGAGAGFAIPHVEVWFKDGRREDRTNEYQYAGPAAQAVAGIELRSGRMSYYLEYKFSWAWISGALTGEESWKNFNMPGDLLRQFLRWWRGEAPKFGNFSTRLFAHQAVVGVGYAFPGKSPAVP